MFIAKLVLELSVLVIFFLLMRRTLRIVFPSAFKLVKHEERDNSSLYLRAESILFLFLGAIFSFSIYWVTYSSIYLLHNLSSSEGALVVNHASLIIPSLIFGFYASTIGTKKILASVVADGVRMKAVIHGHQSSNIFPEIVSVLALVPAVVLLVLQFNVYIKVEDDKIYKKSFGEEVQVYSLNEIKKISIDSSQSVSVMFADGNTLNTAGYSGNINSFLDNISN